MNEETSKRLAETGEQDRKDADIAAEQQRQADTASRAFAAGLKRHYDVLIEAGFGDSQSIYLVGYFQQTCMLGQRSAT